MLLKADFESNMGFLDPTIEAILAAGEGNSIKDGDEVRKGIIKGLLFPTAEEGK